MKKLLYILTLSAMSVALTACYGNHKEPAPEQVWEDADVIDEGYNIISIQALKDMYYAVYPLLTTNPNTNHAANHITITQPVAIKGKVTSNDRPGNFYRNMMIQDATGAIEIKVGKGSLQNEYRVGQTVYVVAENLELGNYRYMLSLGFKSIEGSTYANDYIDLQADIDHHIRKGPATALTSADTLVVKAATYATAIRDPQDLGRLVRIEGATSKYVSGSSDTYPSFLQTTISDNGKITSYVDREFASVIDIWTAYYNGVGSIPAPTVDQGITVQYPHLPSNRLYPTWGYHDIETNNSYYGSAYFEYTGAPTAAIGRMPAGQYVVRSSGYSKFANDPVPANGKTVTFTGFVNKYCSSSGGFIICQIVLNNSTDVKVLN